MKDIVHIDLNAFFAQAEILKDPTLAKKPIAVGYDGRRGVVSTCSYEARAFGVHSGMPIAQAKELCRQLIVVEGHYDYYRYLSDRFFNYLRKRYPILEQASIDECYIDMTGQIDRNDIFNQLFDLQIGLYRNTKLKCSIGYGSCKFLAKMGSDYKKPMGLTILTRDKIESLLWPLSIDKMYGVGKKTAPRLKAIGIETIGDLARTESAEAKKLLGSMFDYLQGEANGYGDDVVDTSAFDPKSCSAERTFSEDVTGYDEVKDMIFACSRDVAQELRKYGKVAYVVDLKLRDESFRTRSKRKTLPAPIDSERDIFYAAMSIFDAFYKGESLRLIGVGCEKVVGKKEASKQDDNG